MRALQSLQPNPEAFFPQTKSLSDPSLMKFSPIYFLAKKDADKNKNEDSKDSRRGYLPEDDDPNKKPEPVRDPEENDKDHPRKEDYTSDGDGQYIKQPTRQVDDPYLPGEEDDLVEED
jgi:hypothetical protein